MKRRARPESKRLPKAKPRSSIRADHEALRLGVVDLNRRLHDLGGQVAELRRKVDELQRKLHDAIENGDRQLDELRDELHDTVDDALAKHKPEHTINERVRAIEVMLGNGTLEKRAIDAMRRAIGANEIKFTRIDPQEYPT